jgi:hypothetical protein
MAFRAGYFTLIARLKSSLKRLCIDTAAGGIACFVILIVLIARHVVDNSAEAVEFAVIIVTNIVYECFLMFLLGYGFVELPRRVWLYADVDYALLRTQIRASRDFKDINDASSRVFETVADVMKTKDMVTMQLRCFIDDDIFLFFSLFYLLRIVLSMYLSLSIYTCNLITDIIVIIIAIVQMRTPRWEHLANAIDTIVSGTVLLYTTQHCANTHMSNSTSYDIFLIRH